MDKQALAQELKAIIEEYLKNQRLDLVELILRYEGRDLFLMVFADRPEGGITISECTRVNRDLGELLEEKNILLDRYILEVSSPGLDRCLKTKSDFLRCLNKMVKFFLNEQISGKMEHDGLINKVQGDLVYIDAKGQIVEIPLNKINKAKQII